MKTFEVKVYDENKELLRRIYITANQKAKAERAAIVLTADYLNCKTGSLSANAEKTEDRELNNVDEYCIKVAIPWEDTKDE